MYEQFYGFSERPFQLTPDPAYFFESVTHKKALSYLGYGLNQGEGFVVITGEVGSGKSTLVAHLKEKLDERGRSRHQRARWRGDDPCRRTQFRPRCRRA